MLFLAFIVKCTWLGIARLSRSITRMLNEILKTNDGKMDQNNPFFKLWEMHRKQRSHLLIAPCISKEMTPTLARAPSSLRSYKHH